MNNWQEWIVGVLVVLCIARLVYGIYTFFRRTRDSGNPCDSCVSGCELKDMMEKKRKRMKTNNDKKDNLRSHQYAFCSCHSGSNCNFVYGSFY